MSDAKWTIFQLYHGENKLHFDEVMMSRPTCWVGFYSVTPLKQQSMGRHVTPLGHILISSHPVFTLTP